VALVLPVGDSLGEAVEVAVAAAAEDEHLRWYRMLYFIKRS
jgi:hypothetical protein